MGKELVGRDDDAVAEFAEPVECLLADEDGEQRAWAASISRRGSGTCGHFDQGCGAALGGCAVGSGGLIGEADLFGKTVQFVLDDGAANRVEHPIEDEDVVDGA